LVETVAENPFIVAGLATVGRNVTGFFWNKAKVRGVTYNKKELLATLVKYEAAIPALSVLVSLALPPEQSSTVSAAIVVIGDILGSFIRKIR